MNFGEKIKMLRKQKGLSRAELGKLVHVSARSITAYETAGAYPRKMETYELLAKALDTDVNYLRTENEEMMSDIGEKYGARGQRQMEALKSQVSALFSGGELNEEEQMAFLMDLNDIFLDAKKKRSSIHRKSIESNRRR